ncbi:MAG TPA: serine/threonine protein phosphatase [Promicromonospora sp.]|nr:serine/threonine protein phosphatase [Promicromonospora sp.]
MTTPETAPVDTWLAVTREDGETVGYLEPVTDDYAEVLPRNRLGHAVGPATDYHAAEELVLGRGLRELAEHWLLDGAEAELTISELSPEGIVLRDAYLSKALATVDATRIPWPDTAHRLRPAP